MRDKFRRAKKYVEDHRNVLTFGAGALAGVTATAYVALKHPPMPKHIEVFLKETPEELAAAAEEIDGFRFLRINGKQGVIDLYTGIDPQMYK